MGPSRQTRATLTLVLASCLTTVPRSAEAQYFGRNKVEYEDFDFKILRTEHFDIHYYSREEEAVQHAARLAERWYVRFSRLLDHELKDRQPLILYGSHPDFAQTNVVSGFLDEGIGGVTESVKRRIAMPFPSTLGETNHVLGHEIVHAFQYDIARRHRLSMSVPLWFVEGLAEYLSVGPDDPLTAMWIRDAAERDALPAIKDLAHTRRSPYRYGQALWAYLAGRFGDQVIGRLLKTGPAFNVLARLCTVTGVDSDRLSSEWHDAVREVYGPLIRGRQARGVLARPLITRRQAGKVNIGPALSPNGREIVFLSERDLFSIDLFLADATTGRITRKLAAATSDAHLEGLQFVSSAGAWDPEGHRFAFATIRSGAPVLTIADVRGDKEDRRIRFPQFGEIFNPTWSPGGGAIAFSALKGGLTDLYRYDLSTNSLRQLTEDGFADLQPAWSPDGSRLAFVTDRFSSELATLRFGEPQLATLDLGSGAVHPITITGLPVARRIAPQWSSDGASLYFVSDPHGLSNIYRVDLETGTLRQITDVSTGVTGLTALSPALSVARSALKLAFSVFREGRFEIHTLESPDGLAGGPVRVPEIANAGVLPPGDRGGSRVSELLAEAALGLPAADSFARAPYKPSIGLDVIGQPYISSGGGRFGSFVRGGMSFLFGDMLGDRKLGAALQAGSRRRDFAAELRYLNREQRWNWGVTAELTPRVRGWFRSRVSEENGEPILAKEAEQWTQIHTRIGGFVAYPFSRAQRIEIGGGVRHITFDREIRSRVFSLPLGHLLEKEERELPAGGDVTLAEASVALVSDSAVFGATSPILGSRSRLEIAPNLGGVSFTTVTADYRRYVMPVRPFTIAVRVLHTGRYGGHADDPRLIPLFAGNQGLVRGYGFGSLNAECAAAATGDCAVLDDLIGSRIAVANLELRFPVVGAALRTIRYGPLPLEGLVFTDAGLAWTGTAAPAFAGGGRRPVRSVGAGVRVNAFGLILEASAVRPLDRNRNGWTFGVDFRPGF